MDAGNIYSTIQEPTRDEIVAVGTTSIVVATARQFAQQKRKTITIRNNSSSSTSIITLVRGLKTATANAGIVLRQYESITDSSESGYDAYQGEWSAICADANGSLSISEV